MKGLFVSAVAASALLLAAKSASAHSSDCVDTSDVVGEKQCGRYGDRWALERTFPVVLSMGAVSTTVDPNGRNFSGKLGKNQPVAYRYDGTDLGLAAIHPGGFDFRVHGFVSSSVYMGVDTLWAFAHASPRTFHADGHELTAHGGLNFFHAKFAFVTGARIPFGRLSLRIEALTGLEVMSLTQHVKKSDGTWHKGNASAAALLLEPRLAVDLWTTPWSTVTAWGGTSVFRLERSFGLTLAIHGRAFDGQFAF